VGRGEERRERRGEERRGEERRGEERTFALRTFCVNSGVYQHNPPPTTQPLCNVN
jgi:hypothetical protein